jgi:hypothetical protein
MEPSVITSYDIITLALDAVRNHVGVFTNDDVERWREHAEAFIAQQASPGVYHIETERLIQIQLHDKTMQNDRNLTEGQLWQAAMFCLTGAAVWWPFSAAGRERILAMPFERRIAVAGALLAAELDRLHDATHAGGLYNALTPAQVGMREGLQHSLFRYRLEQLAKQNPMWKTALDWYDTGIAKPTAAQRLGEAIAAKLADVPAVDGMDIDVLAEAAVKGIRITAAGYDIALTYLKDNVSTPLHLPPPGECANPCGNNYCEEYGCLNGKEVAVNDLLPAPDAVHRKDVDKATPMPPAPPESYYLRKEKRKRK